MNRMLQVLAAVTRRQRTLVQSTRISDSLKREFYEDLKKQSPFFRDWVPGRYDTLQMPFTSYDDLDKQLEDTVAELTRLGWKKTRTEDPTRISMAINGEDWPIFIDGMSGVSISVTMDRGGGEPAGTQEILKALKSKGIKFRMQGEGHAFTHGTERIIVVDKIAGLNAKTLATLVSQALDNGVRTNRPEYVDNPWTKTGRTQIIPGQRNSYEVEIGDVRWSIRTYDKDYMISSGPTTSSFNRLRTTK